MRVQHPERGPGVLKIDMDDPRQRPYIVTFDGGDCHHYSRTSAASKLHPIITVVRPAATACTPPHFRHKRSAAHRVVVCKAAAEALGGPLPLHVGRLGPLVLGRSCTESCRAVGPVLPGTCHVACCMLYVVCHESCVRAFFRTRFRPRSVARFNGEATLALMLRSQVPRVVGQKVLGTLMRRVCRALEACECPPHCTASAVVMARNSWPRASPA